MKQVIFGGLLLLSATQPLSVHASSLDLNELLKNFNKREVVVVSVGAVLMALGAYSVKKSIDIFSQNAEEKRQSLMKWLTKKFNGAALGICGGATIAAGVAAALFSPEIVRGLEKKL